MLKKVRLAKQVGKLSSLVGLYIGQAAVGKFAARGNRGERLGFFTRNVSKWSGRALRSLGVEVETFGFNPELMRSRNFLLVGNHLSYLDIMVTSAVQPIVFVTSVDMGETPFLGQMAELGGSIFVERRNRTQIGRDTGVMADTLRAGHNVMLYPEGTSTDGSKVLPFKKALLHSAIEAGVDIMPVVVKYTEIDGRPFGPETRDRVCWYGDMTFLPHIIGLLGSKRVKAELHFLEPIPVTKESSRHELAQIAYDRIHAVYSGARGSQKEPSTVTALRSTELDWKKQSNSLEN